LIQLSRLAACRSAKAHLLITVGCREAPRLLWNVAGGPRGDLCASGEESGDGSVSVG
jgi:hypothetical protein